MPGRLVTLFPQGTVAGDTAVTKTTPPIDVRGFRSGFFQLRVDGMFATAGGGVLQVSIQTSNDGINWQTPAAPAQFAPVNHAIPIVNPDQFVELDPLASFARLKIELTDLGPGPLGATFHCYAKLMESV